MKKCRGQIVFAYAIGYNQWCRQHFTCSLSFYGRGTINLKVHKSAKLRTHCSYFPPDCKACCTHTASPRTWRPTEEAHKGTLPSNLVFFCHGYCPLLLCGCGWFLWQLLPAGGKSNTVFEHGFCRCWMIAHFRVKSKCKTWPRTEQLSLHGSV